MSRGHTDHHSDAKAERGVVFPISSELREARSSAGEVVEEDKIKADTCNAGGKTQLTLDLSPVGPITTHK